MELMESIVCPGCGCLCDDIDLYVEDNQIQDVINVCAWGLSKFKGTRKFHPDRKRARLVTPTIRKDLHHETVEMEEALNRATEILVSAQRPLVYGLTNIGYRAQVEAFELTKDIKGIYEPEGMRFRRLLQDEWKKTGLPVFSLEDVKDKMNCSIFWGFNPLHSCPRFLTRYAHFPRGKFTERGYEDRKIFVVDILKTEMEKFAECFLAGQPGSNGLIANALRLLISGQQPEDIPLDGQRLKDMAEQIKTAGFGAVFIGRGIDYDPSPKEAVQAIFSLISDLNKSAYFTFFPIYNEFNAHGAAMVLSRKVGDVCSADLGHPPMIKEKGDSAMDHLDEIDAILSVGSDLFWTLSEEKINFILERKIPIIVISPYYNRTTGTCEVAIPAALSGIEEEEIAYRMDGLPLVLKQVVPAETEGAKDILKRMRALIS